MSYSCTLRVIGTGTDGVDESFGLFINKHSLYGNSVEEKCSYLFNIGEGIQRSCGEHHVSLKSLKRICTTRIDDESISGLPGLVMHMAAYGKDMVDIIGPVGIHQVLDGAKTFVQRTHPVLNCIEIVGRDKAICKKRKQAENEVFERRTLYTTERHTMQGIADDHLQIIPVALDDYESACPLCNQHQPSDRAKEKASRQAKKRDAVESRPKVDDEDPHRTWLMRYYTAHDPSKIAHIDTILNRYVSQFSDLQMKLHAKYNTTMETAFVSNTKETTVCTPEDATEASESPPSWVNIKESISKCKTHSAVTKHVVCYIIRILHDDQPNLWVVDCPDINWIDKIIENPVFQSPSCAHMPTLIVHFCATNVFQNERYQTWLSQFSKRTQHLVFDRNNLDTTSNEKGYYFGLNYELSLRQHTMLYQLMPSMFSHCEQIGATPESSLDGLKWTCSNANIGHVQCAAPKQMFIVLNAKAKHGFIKSKLTCLPDRHTASIVTSANDSFVPKITFLGTGAAAPSRLRSCSSIYVQCNVEFNGLLIDAGEGCLGQLWRTFGNSIPKVISSLWCIWISHKHADHHTGLLKILLTYRRYTKKQRVIVIAPQSVLDYVFACLSSMNISLDFLETTTNTSFNQAKDAMRKLFLGKASIIENLYSVPVWHCYDAFGLVVIFSGNIKLVYSGDTRPCERLVNEGRDAMLLIHEATFENDMQVMAKAKKHSTIHEAIDVGRRMGARHLMLTHFSQRYPNIPVMRNVEMGVSIAFDAMTVTLSDESLQYLACKMPQIAKAFSKSNLYEKEGENILYKD